MSRVQLALNVDDLDEAITFYSKLFNTAPAKVKEGYANFAVAEPPLKLVLIENPGRAAPLTTSASRWSPVTPCTRRSPGCPVRACSPTRRSAPRVASPLQDKVWVTGPAGEKWEVYTVLADSETFGASPHQDADCACTEGAVR